MLEIQVLGCGGLNNVWSKCGTKKDHAIWMLEIQVLGCGGPNNVWSKFCTKKKITTYGIENQCPALG